MTFYAKCERAVALTHLSMVSTTVDRYLEVILNHLGCSTMSEPDGGRPQNVLYNSIGLLSLCIFAFLTDHEFKWKEEEMQYLRNNC